jgi:hypothetical protein
MQRGEATFCRTVDILLCQGPAEDLLTGFPKGTAQLIFSSPPYFDRERYSDEPSQSYIRFPKYSDWKRHFLEVAIVESLARKPYLGEANGPFKREPLFVFRK